MILWFGLLQQSEYERRERDAVDLLELVQNRNRRTDGFREFLGRRACSCRDFEGEGDAFLCEHDADLDRPPGWTAGLLEVTASVCAGDSVEATVHMLKSNWVGRMN
jgi:hypothetical protein